MQHHVCSYLFTGHYIQIENVWHTHSLYMSFTVPVAVSVVVRLVGVVGAGVARAALHVAQQLSSAV